MPYQYVSERQDYSDLSSGRVLYSRPGFPAFPVRLASEVFLRCLALRAGQGFSGRCRIYDPCCGGAYHLTALAYLHWDRIESIQASDIDPQGVNLAALNLSLLTEDGMDRRMAELTALRDQYHKPSHTEALESAARLRADLLTHLALHPIHTVVFQSNVFDPQYPAEVGAQKIDLLLSDVPYGLHTTWKGGSEPGLGPNRTPVEQFLENLLPIVSSRSLLALCADKSQKIAHPAYQRVEHFRLGKRQAVILKMRSGETVESSSIPT